jgi:putative membrane protein
MGGSLHADAAGPWADYWGHGGGWWWLWWPIGLVFWLAVVVGLVWLVVRRNPHTNEPSPLQRAREILAERYASGEIDTEEYEQRMEHLR